MNLLIHQVSITLVSNISYRIVSDHTAPPQCNACILYRFRQIPISETPEIAPSQDICHRRRANLIERQKRIPEWHNKVSYLTRVWLIPLSRVPIKVDMRQNALKGPGLHSLRLLLKMTAWKWRGNGMCLSSIPGSHAAITYSLWEHRDQPGLFLMLSRFSCLASTNCCVLGIRRQLYSLKVYAHLSTSDGRIDWTAK